jgi:hypothetical protein
MKKLSLILAATFLGSVSAYADTPRLGSSHPLILVPAPQASVPASAAPAKKDIPVSMWVYVAQDISNADKTFHAGGEDDGSCLFLLGGQIQVVGVNQFGVLVKYTLPPGLGSVVGTPCPAGTVAYMSAADVSALPAAAMTPKKMQYEAGAKAAAGQRAREDDQLRPQKPT